MKNVSSLKTNNMNSPKTPGGISKSLLTPCRRLGLSRNWRKSGPSPFISPLTTSQVDDEDKKEIRKRKEPVADEKVEETSHEGENDINTYNIDSTPSRNIQMPRRKRSKTLISSINQPQKDSAADLEVISEMCNKTEVVNESQNIDSHNSVSIEVSPPVHKKSRQKNNCKTDKDTFKDEPVLSLSASGCTEQNLENKPIHKEEEAVYTIKEKNPNDLRKECVVVIQRRIFKNVGNSKKSGNTESKSNKSIALQCDSDSDEAPLINLQKQNSTISKSDMIIDDDNDFIDTKASKSNPTKIKDINSPKNKLKINKTTVLKPKKIIEPKLPSQNTFGKASLTNEISIVKPEKVKEQKPTQSYFYDDDDDDAFDNKKTILIRKSYDKVPKPIKAKSTGSITQRDIDKLKERIEAKKKLLLAQSLTPDTEELRNLIKRWQKGCQDALMELLDLMRNKFPDKERMDYSEMLRTLKIPPSLVGYDSENDCFNSPDDASIILGQYKDL